MKSSRYSPEQVAFALSQAEECTRVSEVCRKMGTRNNTLSPHRALLGAKEVIDPAQVT